MVKQLFKPEKVEMFECKVILVPSRKPIENGDLLLSPVGVLLVCKPSYSFQFLAKCTRQEAYVVSENSIEFNDHYYGGVYKDRQHLGHHKRGGDGELLNSGVNPYYKRVEGTTEDVLRVPKLSPDFLLTLATRYPHHAVRACTGLHRWRI
jgi:hypothetical protein